MTDTNKVADEVDRLLKALDAEELAPDFLSSVTNNYSVESRNEVVSRIALTFDPIPQGRLLGRLLFTRTEQNKDEMAIAFIANLHSSDAPARVSGLYGLETLEHPWVNEFALLSLRDNADDVVYAACQILLPAAKQDARILNILQEVYAARQGNTQFNRSVNLLRAQGIAS